jgi:uncharacterized protein YggE
MDRLFYLTASAMLALLLFTVAPAAAQGLDDDLRAMMRSAGRTVTVSGKGTARAAPDEATVRFGVVTEAETPEAAREQNAEAAANALNTARELVPEENVRLETLRLQPRYDYSDDERELVGYEARRAAVVRVEDLETLPALVARIVERGANELDGVEYGLSDRSGVRREALQEAAEEARAKAQVLAQSLGAQVGAVLQISEQQYGGPQPRRVQATAMRAQSAQDAAPSPDAFAGGQIEVTATAQATFALE